MYKTIFEIFQNKNSVIIHRYKLSNIKSKTLFDIFQEEKIQFIENFNMFNSFFYYTGLFFSRFFS